MLNARWVGATRLVWTAFRGVTPAGQQLAWLLALLPALLLAPRAAEAHALLVRADPLPNAELAHPPSTLEFWFSEPLEETFTAARILRADGTQVPTAAALVDPEDPTHLTLPLESIEPGIYTVVWQTLSSVDGHEWVGSFPLTVLNADGTRPTGSPLVVAEDHPNRLPPLGDALLRWLSLLGAALLVGSLSMRWLLPLPALDEGPIHSVDRLISSTAMAGTLLLTGAGWLQFLLQTLRLGEPASCSSCCWPPDRAGCCCCGKCCWRALSLCSTPTAGATFAASDQGRPAWLATSGLFSSCLMCGCSFRHGRHAL